MDGTEDMDWNAGVETKQAGCKSASNVNEKRKKDAKDERQIFMMTVATSVVQ